MWVCAVAISIIRKVSSRESGVCSFICLRLLKSERIKDTLISLTSNLPHYHGKVRPAGIRHLPEFPTDGSFKKLSGHRDEEHETEDVGEKTRRQQYYPADKDQQAVHQFIRRHVALLKFMLNLHPDPHSLGPG